MSNLAAVWQSLIVCGGTDCTYADFIKLINVAINDLIVIATLLVVVVLMFAGVKLLTAGGDEGALKEVKKMLTSVLWGFLWILVAWLLVYTIMHTLLDPHKYTDILGAPK